MSNYLLAGGGTAGHVNPLLALAETIRNAEPDSNVLTLGTAEGLEARLVPQRGFELATIAKLPFPRKPSLYAAAFPFKFLGATLKVLRIIRDREISCVVGFGGYASAPAYLAARLSKTPLVIHEANALPGWANRWGAKWASAVAVTFGNTQLPNSTVTGMPLRREIEILDMDSAREMARVSFGLDPQAATILVTGGSLGARRINEAVIASRSLLEAAGIQVLHIVGEAAGLPEEKVGGYLRLTYCDRMDQAFAAADLVISRAGASTVSEISALGIPAVYVPYPVGNGEQSFNAADAIAAQAARMVLDKDFDADFIAREIIPLVSSRPKLNELAKNAGEIGIRNGSARLLALVSGVLRRAR